MKISVVIPAYNATGTIRETLNSVLAQTAPPDEILVMDDGSTDDTLAILRSYEPQVTVLQHTNKGPSAGRNALCAAATGDIIAFVDSDDVWHPQYLEVQRRLFLAHPDAVVYFTGHMNIYGDVACDWKFEAIGSALYEELIPGVEFFKRYNTKNGPFACYSFCCIPKRVLNQLGQAPFREDGAEDFYCTALISLLGPAVYVPITLAAYRVRAGSHSSKRIAGLAARVRAFECLRERFTINATSGYSKTFRLRFASHRRVYAKYLLGTHQTRDARAQLRHSIRDAWTPLSLVKSVLLLVTTYLPDALQPSWPTGYQR